jgi:SAM-dependent methyltransferase
MLVTESWPPNAARARTLLGPRGVRVLETEAGAALPLETERVELVTARHPVRPDWPEIHRVLRPGGRYLAQHVGPGRPSSSSSSSSVPCRATQGARTVRLARGADQVEVMAEEWAAPSRWRVGDGGDHD